MCLKSCQTTAVITASTILQRLLFTYNHGERDYQLHMRPIRPHSQPLSGVLFSFPHLDQQRALLCMVQSGVVGKSS